MMNKNNQINSHNQQVNQNDNSDEEEDEQEEPAGHAGQYDKLAPLPTDSTGLTPQQMQQQQQHQQMMLNQYGSGNSGMMTPQQQMMLNQPGSGNFNMMTPQQQMLLNQQMMLNQHGSGNYGMMTPQQQMLLNQQMMLNQHGSGNYGMVPPHPHNMGAMGTGMMNVGSTSFSNFQQPNMTLRQLSRMSTGSSSSKKTKKSKERQMPCIPKYKKIFEFRYEEGEFVPYPTSELQIELNLFPYIMEASIMQDLAREWVLVKARNDFKSFQKFVVIHDNSKVELKYAEILEANKNFNNEFDDGDKWANHISNKQRNSWPEDVVSVHQVKTQKAKGTFTGKFKQIMNVEASAPPKKLYMQQLISFSVLGRAMLLYVSLHNATFGMKKTDFNDLNEIVVVLSSPERDAIKNIHKKHKEFKKNETKGLCTDLVDEEKSISDNTYYSNLIVSLCENDREEIFLNGINQEDKGKDYFVEMKKDSEVLIQFFENIRDKKLTTFMGSSNRIRFISLLTKANYERLRYVLSSINDGNPIVKLDEAALLTKKEEDKELLSLVRMIIIDAFYGRPFMMALLLHDKLQNLYVASKGNEKIDLYDAFNDASRIFLLRGPIDLVDIVDAYSQKAALRFYQKKTTTKNPQLIDDVNKKLTGLTLLKKHLDVIIENFQRIKKQDESNVVEKYKEMIEWLTKKQSNGKIITTEMKIYDRAQNSSVVAKSKIAQADDEEEEDEEQDEEEKEALKLKRAILKEDDKGDILIGTMQEIVDDEKAELAQKFLQLQLQQQQYQHYPQQGYQNYPQQGYQNYPQQGMMPPQQFQQNLQQGMMPPQQFQQHPQQGMMPPQQFQQNLQQGMMPPQQFQQHPQQGMMPPQQFQQHPQQGMMPPQQFQQHPQQGMMPPQQFQQQQQQPSPQGMPPNFGASPSQGMNP
ncbi:hypothetical protein niasHT_010863 [Heterodera trifolii]|uniref:Annexin n=1 Tax=Heterodera trifolii TaxID=157864 RepID=A0ABD2LD01_9BILA